MSVDVEIYMNNLVKFFRENPKDLLNLIPKEREEEFYIKIKETAYSNHEKGEDASLTHNQLVDICSELKGEKQIYHQNIQKILIKTNFGGYSLN